MWLGERDYEHLNDVEITVNAQRYRLIGNVQFVISIVVVCAFLYFRFVAHRVAP